MPAGSFGNPYEPNRYYGKYRGIVRDNVDKQKLGRIRAVVPDVLGEELITNWAYPVFPIDNVSIPRIGTAIYIEFENGDVERPIYTGCWFGKFDEENVYTYNSHIIGQEDETMEDVHGTDAVTTPDGETVKEPEGAFKEGEEVYPKLRSYKTLGGLIIEIDDSQKEGTRLQIFHPSGKFVEVHPDGSVVTKTKGDFRSVEGDESKLVSGKSTVEIEGDVALYIGGAESKRVSGDVSYDIKGSLIIDVDGPITLRGSKIEFKGGSGPSSGVITGASVCPYTGAPHGDESKSVGATK